MESSWHSSRYDGIYEVTQHMASTQQSKGDCLAKGHMSPLPEGVHLDLKQNNFTNLLNIWESGYGADDQKIFSFALDKS
ncbi:Uncharacterized protein TCM_012700 [Theobroma cacao]|uniref:Uncharacterized protein n=1 Tax=Theobroma cacao TaxID=3641 RepID=A0A061FUS8_THECC|nr:Uncharacterized protein TCM_012700 [Theobroma cacao]